MQRDYDLEIMRAAKSKYQGCADGVRQNCKNLVSAVESAADENTSTQIRKFTEEFNGVIAGYLESVDSTGEYMDGIIKRTAAYDATQNA